MKINSFDNLIKYITKYKNNAKKMSNIKENFKEYLEICNEQNIKLFINQLKSIPEMDTTLYYNSDSIFRKFGIEIILKMTKEMDFNERFKYIYEMYEGIRMKYYTMDEYLEDLMKANEIEYICNNMNQVINFADINALTTQGLLKKLKQLDNEKFSDIHSSIVCKMTGINPKFIDTTTLLGLTMIVDEVAQNENVDISDLEYVEKGTLTDVYKLGNKVVKFGKNRLTDKIPYHRRILQPLIRRRVLLGFKDLYIEISEYIQPDNTITDEEAYLIYKELRDDGIIWLDAKRENLGRLEKDNIVHFNEPLYVKNETVGYIPETIKQDNPLNKGDLVIIDTDFLFREQDFDEKILDSHINTDFYQACEQRYQEENKCHKSKGLISKLRDVMER
jgi:hypothetical protein